MGKITVPNTLVDIFNNPHTEDFIRACILNGQGFSANIGLFTSGSGTNNYPLSIFNPNNSNVNVLIYSIQASNGSGGLTAILQLVTSNPAFGTQLAPINQLANGPNSQLPISAVTWANSNQSIAAPYAQVATIASATAEMLTNGAAILLPKGSNNGLVTYIQTYGAGINSILARWIEFS
jgi:hypothetical protein